MDVPDYVEKAVSRLFDSIEELSESLRQLANQVRRLRTDVETLFESQDMNVWVLVKGIQTGQISSDKEPQEALRAVAELQQEYEAVMSIFEFVREMSDE